MFLPCEYGTFQKKWSKSAQKVSAPPCFSLWSLRVLICYPPGGLLGVILGLLEHSWGPPGSLRTSFSPIFAPPELIFRLRGRFGAQPTGDPATEPLWLPEGPLAKRVEDAIKTPQRLPKVNSPKSPPPGPHPPATGPLFFTVIYKENATISVFTV